MAKNSDVVKAFFNGQDNVKTANLYIENDKLINYYTVLAERLPREGGEFHFILNETKYSRSTSTIQSVIYKQASGHSFETVDNKPMGVSKLQPLNA